MRACAALHTEKGRVPVHVNRKGRVLLVMTAQLSWWWWYAMRSDAAGSAQLHSSRGTRRPLRLPRPPGESIGRRHSSACTASFQNDRHDGAL